MEVGIQASFKSNQCSNTKKKNRKKKKKKKEIKNRDSVPRRNKVTSLDGFLWIGIGLPTGQRAAD